MDEFLQRTKSRLVPGSKLPKVHAVLGSKTCDLDCVASVLSYAFFLDKNKPLDAVCVPVLISQRSELHLANETRIFLEQISVSESCLICWDEIDLHQLNTSGKLSLTLLSNNVLTSEDCALESAVVRVINPCERWESSEELQESSSTTLVAREILQEAPELLTLQLALLLRGAILFESISAPSKDRKLTNDQEELLCFMEKKFGELPLREDVITVLKSARPKFQGANIEELLLKEVKELSDGDIKVAISTVHMNLEDYSNCPSLIGDLKVFNDDHHYEGLVLVSTSFQGDYQQCQQVAVYSGNLELLNQICCELEEAQNSSLVLEPIECVLDQIQVYKQGNPSVDVEQIITLMKEFIDRRQPSIVSNSRTSSTEAVAGSATLSQGSSGITDMYSSDVEPQPMSVHFMENSQDLNESVQVYGEVNADLVSPDSGLATIRSNRSSKESSVFLSDDSPVAEIVSSYLNPIHGFPSFNPVSERETTQEQKPLSGSKNENYDLFSFDPLHSSNIPSMTSDADFSFANDFLIFQPLDIQAQTQLDDRVTQSQLEKDMPTLSADGEARLVEFYDGSVNQVVNEDKLALEDEFSTEYAHAELISNPIGDNMDKKVPRTPMNSLVECSPLDDGLPTFFPEDVIEKISEMGNKDYALASFCQPNMSNDFEGNTKQTTSENAGIWSAHEQEYVLEQSPDLIMEYNQTSQVKSMCPDQPENLIKECNPFLQDNTDMKQTVIPPNSEDGCLWHSPFSQTVLKSTDTTDQHAVESCNTVQYHNKTKQMLDDLCEGKMLTQQDENTSPLDMWDNAVLNKKERTKLQDNSDNTSLNVSAKGLENNGPEELGIEILTAIESDIRNTSLNDMLCTTSNAELFPSMENVQSTAVRPEGDNWFNNQNVHYCQEKQDVGCSSMDHSTLKTDQPTSVNTKVITTLYQGETESDVSRSDFIPLTPDMKNVTTVETHLIVTEKGSKGGPVISEEDGEILSNSPILCNDGVLVSKSLFSEDIFPAVENTQSGYSEAWNSPVESPTTIFEDTFSTTDVLDMQVRKRDDNPAFPASQYTSIIFDDKQKHPIEENLYSCNPFPQESHHAETYNWNSSLFSSDLWIPGMLGDIQLTPPEEEKMFKLETPETSYDKANVELVKEGQLTPEISEEGLLPTKEGSCETDMWSSLVEKDHQETSNSAIPENLQIWNTTIRDDTLSCDTSPGTGDSSESSEMWNALGQRGSLVSPLQVVQESMDMWNTTIQEDSQPSETSPEERGSTGNLEPWGTSTENLFQSDVDYSESSEIGPAETICSANEDGDFNEVNTQTPTILHAGYPHLCDGTEINSATQTSNVWSRTESNNNKIKSSEHDEETSLPVYSQVPRTMAGELSVCDTLISEIASDHSDTPAHGHNTPPFAEEPEGLHALKSSDMYNVSPKCDDQPDTNIWNAVRPDEALDQQSCEQEEVIEGPYQLSSENQYEKYKNEAPHVNIEVFGETTKPLSNASVVVSSIENVITEVVETADIITSEQGGSSQLLSSEQAIWNSSVETVSSPEDNEDLNIIRQCSQEVNLQISQRIDNVLGSTKAQGEQAKQTAMGSIDSIQNYLASQGTQAAESEISSVTTFEQEDSDKKVNCSDIDLVTPPPRKDYFSPEEEENHINISDDLEVKQISTNEPHQTMEALEAFSDASSSDAASPVDFTGFETTEDEITIIQESPYMGEKGPEKFSFDIKGVNTTQKMGSSTESCFKKENPCTMEASKQETENNNPLIPAGGAMAPAKYTFTTPDGASFSQVEQEVFMAKNAESMCTSVQNARYPSDSKVAYCRMSTEVQHIDVWEDLSPEENEPATQCSFAQNINIHDEYEEHVIDSSESGSNSFLEVCYDRQDHHLVVDVASNASSVSFTEVGHGLLDIESMDGYKTSPELLEMGSGEDVGVNSDEESFGLEMDYIIVSGRESALLKEDIAEHRQEDQVSEEVSTQMITTVSQESVSTSSPETLKQSLANPEKYSSLDSDSVSFHTIGDGTAARVKESLDEPKESKEPPDERQTLMLEERSNTLDSSPEECSRMTDTAGSGSEISVKEVCSPFTSNCLDKAESFFLHYSNAPCDSAGKEQVKETEMDVLGSLEMNTCPVPAFFPESGKELEDKAGSIFGNTVKEASFQSTTTVVDEAESFLLHGIGTPHESTGKEMDLLEEQITETVIKVFDSSDMKTSLIHADFTENRTRLENMLRLSSTIGGSVVEHPLTNIEVDFPEEHLSAKDVCYLDVTHEPLCKEPKAKICLSAPEDVVKDIKEDFSRSLPEDVGMDISFDEDMLGPDGADNRPAEPPNSLDLNGAHPQRKKLSAPEINLSLDQSEGSILSDDNLDTPDDLDINVDDLDTPDEADSLDFTGHGNELEWEEEQATKVDEPKEEAEPIPEYTAEEERQDARLWRTVVIGEQEHRIDMKSIEPYQKVISHGGYYGDGLNAIIVFAACFLPDSSRADYHYVMENLFLFVISTLELMVAEDYMIVYLNGATPRRKMPGLGWIKKCYQMIDRRLRKNLKSFIIVHPSWFIRTILAITRPFISSKFSSKIKYVNSLAELGELIPMEYVHIPESIIKLDEELKEAAEFNNSFLNGSESTSVEQEVDKNVPQSKS
ncbi:uncharacterized protein LOC117421070 isoform X4 [Acipenser ruthenus]|uniref:uncharacterized protein LOC117421070 isoform X4 n=1 Tax=Acipenser ruthenus TaxID=7906 RepID=UPI002740E732|nr:uncharacterized protein LOC117421070 isoform X4 [Acipenser ruthenus]